MMKDIIARAKAENRGILTEIEAKQILAGAGICCTDTRLAKARDEAVSLSGNMGYPVVLKISSPDITHKSDAGGVKINLSNKNEVEKAFDVIMNSARDKFPNAKIEGISVQPMARPGIEVILGMTKDPNFGPVLMFGLGGVMVEILKDVAFKIVPLKRRDAFDMIREIKGYRILEGYRGQEPADIEHLEKMIMNLSDFVYSHPLIKELDMNPVFAYKDGAIVVDARIILE